MTLEPPEMTETESFDLALRKLGLDVVRDPMEFVDGVEAAMLDTFQRVDPETQHVFTKGMYARSIFVPAGTILTTKIHRTQHQFVAQTGHVSVWTHDFGWMDVKAPYHGVTEPGTRRIVQAHTDTVWTTFHPNPDNITDLAEIEKMLIMDHTNLFLERGAP